MDKLLQFINNETSNTYANLKLVSVFYDKDNNVGVFKFIYKDMVLTVKDKTLLTQLIEKYYKNAFKVDIKLKRSYLDDDVIIDFVYKYISQNFTNITNFYKEDILPKISGDKVNLHVCFCEQFYDYMVNKDIVKLLTNECNANFFAEYDVVINKKEKNEELEKALKQKEKVFENQIENLANQLIYNDIKVNEVVKFVGEELSNIAIQISTIKSTIQKVQICGKIGYFLKRSFKAKKPNANGEFPEKDYYTFTLNDGTGTMQCVYFPLKADVDKIVDIKDGDEVILQGDVEEFGSRVNFKIKSINFCKLPEINKQEVLNKAVNNEYIYVSPAPYQNIAQPNFLVQEKPINDFLMKNDIVVFDFETTGLDYSTCEIIEIGAVKLRAGKMIETFSCFVKPKGTISDEITKITGITNEMVKDAYSISQIIPDFYKFCYDCVLVAYNIDFDYKFLNNAATKMRYKFTNRQVDALYLARVNVKGAKNFQLKNIAVKLGVSLDNAHRAINDAIATAEVLMLISDNVAPK